MQLEYGKCSRCGSELMPIWRTKEEFVLEEWLEINNALGEHNVIYVHQGRMIRI